MSSRSGSLDLLKISRFCMQVRSKIGFKVDAITLVKDPSYAAQIFQEIQLHDNLDEELLITCLELANMLTPETFHAQREANQDSSPKKHAVTQNLPQTTPEIKQPIARDLSFGPRG